MIAPERMLRVALLLGATLLVGCRSETGTRPAEGVRPTGSATVVQDTAALRDVLQRTQSVYVPVYSHIYHQSGERVFNLTATLSIRNTDLDTSIYVLGVRYYDSAGEFIRHYAERPLQLKPLASVPFVVEERDLTGGVGANFIVEWSATRAVSPPIIEAVMISTRSQQGVSFITRGQVIPQDTAPSPGAERLPQ